MAPDPPLFVGEVKNNNQLAMGASRVGSGWQESIGNHMTMRAGDKEQQEHVANDEGSNKEGKGGKGDGDAMRVVGNEEAKGGKSNGVGDNGGVQQRGQWQQWQKQWRQGW